ncbi:heparan-alpha-glucosaminide N-acetyltransferase-like [Eublepharis macularius]|uniref:Heparan-alpha-glucosaminide N-acetyltransferase-like n=1 Tax=Eublepharis macularius TaxID=481883 RepID=A0AA97L2M5_EUBMA|nr:heparan-alpha-glucosaminide N-acetyltransferase-like [Eublepharis macularius]
MSVAVSTRFPLAMDVFMGRNVTNVVCRWQQLYGEQGQYLVSVKREMAGKNKTEVSCTLMVQKDPENSYIPLWIALALFVALTLLYFLGFYVSKLHCTQKCCHWLRGKLVSYEPKSTEPPRPVAEFTKSRRLLSLDTFRGFSLTLMIFVNYGGGGYWFFEHAAWNGLTVADLVMAWFVFIMGTSVGLAFHAIMKRGATRIQLLRKLTWRTLILFVIGVCFLNYGPVDGPLSWSWARIPGVLQRLGFTYFVLALMQACFGIKDIDNYQFGNWWAAIRDVILYWPEWIIMAALETLWLCLTLLLPVPGCPRGYLGPGGIGDDGKYPNCTGGAAGYIDKWLLGENHIYRSPTCKELYKTTQPFDPEGILGTINSILMAFFGLQAGKIILLYRRRPQSILKRFLFWAILLGIISAILSKCTQNEGFIPINKNLWSLSYVTTLSSFSFVLLGIMFYVLDVKNWWGGQPFIFPGMNSIFVYVGHSLLGSFFPFSWELKFPASHAEPLFQNLLGTSIWVFLAYLLYKKKFFLKI